MVSYESRSITRAEKFIRLVLYSPLGAADTHSHSCTHTHAGEIESEWEVVKSLQVEGEQLQAQVC